MASTDVERALGEYIAKEIRYDQEQPEIEPDEPLLEAIDSTDMLRLVLFVEERFGVRVEDDELVPENFGSLRQLAEFVEGKRSQ
jgi:acyl carrier protein